MKRAIENKVVVITGASSGIGRCTALYLARKGARLVLTARRADALQEVVREIEDAGGQAIARPGDVTREDDLREVAEAAMLHFGRIDGWVNNAGVYIQGRVQDITLEEYRRILDVNFVGVVNGTQRALEVMLPQGDGVIVQVSSVAARRGVPYTTPYSASKAAIVAFTSAVRAELYGSGVRLSILYPPTVDTPIYHSARGKLGVVPKPAPTIADPREAAKAIEHLLRTGDRHRYFGWARALAAVNAVSPAAADRLLHRVQGFTYSDIRAHPDDNIDAPSETIPPAIRVGWAEPGVRGLTLDEAIRVLPLEFLFWVAVLGFAAARLTRRLRNGI